MYIGSQKLMQSYDRCLLEHGYSIVELVDKASDCLLKHMHGKKYSLLCGPGNNGADGLSLAIKLANRNHQVDIYIFEDQNHLSQANRYYLDQCYELGLHVVLLNEDILEDVFLSICQSDVIIDAMFGFGLNSSPRGMYQAVIEEVNRLYDQEVIAVDIPTGLDCNRGTPYQSVVCATQTITLTAFKNGFLNPDSQSFTGQVFVEMLDVEDVAEEVGLYQIADASMVEPLLKERRYDGHKGTYGRIGCITGCHDYKGAALLSGKSAVYTGSGIVTVITDQEVIDSLTLFCPEATTLLRPSVFHKDDFDKFNALLIGCGLGLSLEAYRYVIDVCTLSHQPLLIDADALTILSSNLDLLKNQEREIVLTPHMGEFQRLCDFDENDDILYVAREFAREKGVVLVLKGPYTIVTDGQESYRVQAGNKAMASGGMGDVLAGMIASLLGQGYRGIQAALLGVYLHGYCGDEIAKEAYTVLPSRLIEEIPEVMLKILKK
ncbi:MAG: NAD(P)H-hydrate dehydratase [Longibaculum sp.]